MSLSAAAMEGGVSSVPVGTLLWTVFESIIEVFLLCLAGYTLARVGIIDKATQRKINVVQVTLLTPCLMTSKIAFSLTPGKLKEMWIIPLGFVIVSSVSAGVAFVMSKMFRLSRSQRAFAMAASMFQNSNSLPIALIGSLVIEVPGLKWGHDDSQDQMLGRALTYLVVYSTLGMMLRWSYGVKLLSQADDEVPPVDAAPATANGDAHGQGSTAPAVSSPGEMAPPAAMETDPIHSSMDEMRRETQDEAARARARASGAVRGAWRGESVSALSMHPYGNGSRAESPSASSGDRQLVGSPPVLHAFEARRGSSGFSKRRTSSGATARPRRPTRTESGREFWGLPEAAKTPRSLSDQEEASESEDEAQAASDEEWGDSNLPGNIHRRRRQLHTPPYSRLGSVLRRTKTKGKAVLSTINQFMTVPMYASIASVVIALIPPLQSVLGRTKPLVQAIKSAGQCSIPMTLVVLGAFFYTPPAPPQEGKQALQPAAPTSGNKASFLQRKLEQIRHPKASTTHPGENRAVFVAVVSRMIIVPALLLPFLAWIAVEDWFEAAEDPVFILAATLLISSPPALTLAQITQAASGDAFERLISKTISWSYAVLTPPLTLLYVVLGLLFGRL